MNEALRLSHLSLLSPPGAAAASGVPKVAGTLLRYFETREDLRVDALTLVDGLSRNEKQVRGSVTYHYVGCKPKFKTATLYAREVGALKRAINSSQPDVVHGQPTSEYLLAATSGLAPSVLTIHGLVARESAGLGTLHPASIANRVRDMLQRVAIRRARHIIACSAYVEDYLKGRTQARLWPIANPIDEEFFQIPEADWSGLRILCAGIVSTRKNQMLILRACRVLRQKGVPFSCRLIGPFSPGAESQVKGFVDSHELSDSVEIRGLVPLAEVEASYQWANAVALASREETMPLSLMQGMAAGRAVFGANRGGIPTLLNNGQLGKLFDSEDANDLAGYLQLMSQNPAKFSNLAVQARQYALANFHPQAIADKTVAVYCAVKDSAR